MNRVGNSAQRFPELSVSLLGSLDRSRWKLILQRICRNSHRFNIEIQILVGLVMIVSETLSSFIDPLSRHLAKNNLWELLRFYKRTRDRMGRFSLIHPFHSKINFIKIGDKRSTSTRQGHNGTLNTDLQELAMKFNESLFMDQVWFWKILKSNRINEIRCNFCRSVDLISNYGS